MLYRFGKFELDQQRAELRGPDGAPIKLRRKTFDMLTLFATSAGRVLSKQELIDAIWPNVHVGEDSLFQCIREIRAALGDEQHEMLKVVPSRGYLLDVPVSAEQVSARPPASETDVPAPARVGWLSLSRLMAPGTVIGFTAVVGLAVAAPILAPDFFKRGPLTVAVMPIESTGNDAQAAAMATAVTARLTDGLARIETIRVVAPPASGDTRADYVVTSELQKADNTWSLRSRIVATASEEVQAVSPVVVAIKDVDSQMQQSRLAAGVGHQLALRFNATVYPEKPTDGASLGSAGRAAVEQAIASINRTSRERFADARTMLEKALADDPNNIEIEVALAALKLRGIQLVWFPPEERAAAEKSARDLLEHALRARPNSIPVLEAYCRFLSATHEFVDALVACARTLSFDPWNGAALYQTGLSQIFLGRFEDALETFKQADRYDTPEVSRWTWLLGAGYAYLLMGQAEEAVPWLQRSIAITPASGRPHMLLSAAYVWLGQADQARAAMAKGMELRPGTTLGNVVPPFKNTSPIFRAALERILKADVEAGLPER